MHEADTESDSVTDTLINTLFYREIITMFENTYWANSTGQVAVSNSESMNKSLFEMGWVRINRSEYRKRVRAHKREHALDRHAQGEQGNEVDDA